MVSACLLGIHCRYDGGHSACSDLMELIPSVSLIPFCPEQLGGLSTPRSPANMTGGDGYDILAAKAKVINADGHDVTQAFVKGAEEANAIALVLKASIAIMKDRSPSCGINTPVYEKPVGYGVGVTAALFNSRGIKLFEVTKGGHFSCRKFQTFLEQFNDFWK
ncbi:conserved hypothetical protein [uncultured Desulfobacterium sp.]|uniref:Uncharacterized protein n=1 Tax=uncultured Desulfobacterium sp. TaxID=201089 RepID=A0A445N008_9BACT|nr:conserved hypothetical protein [uncultured Desulfobacterium sp.]